MLLEAEEVGLRDASHLKHVLTYPLHNITAVQNGEVFSVSANISSVLPGPKS